jgi:hypothetical protein
MTTERLHEVHAARPFRPFRIYLADGGVIEVRHPESLAYSLRGRTAVQMALDESTQFIDLLLVSRIEVMNGQAQGRSRRR